MSGEEWEVVGRQRSRRGNEDGGGRAPRRQRRDGGAARATRRRGQWRQRGGEPPKVDSSAVDEVRRALSRCQVRADAGAPGRAPSNGVPERHPVGEERATTSNQEANGATALVPSGTLPWSAVAGGVHRVGDEAASVPSLAESPPPGEAVPFVPENGTDTDTKPVDWPAVRALLRCGHREGHSDAPPSAHPNHRHTPDELPPPSGPTSHPSVRPGLANTGNSCFLNAVLQALLAVRPFADTCTALAQVLPTPTVLANAYGCPLLSGFMRLVSEWQAWRRLHATTAARTASRPAPYLVPDYFWDGAGVLLQSLARGGQEDAQELLTLLLDGLHDEAVQLLQALHEAVPLCDERVADRVQALRDARETERRIAAGDSSSAAGDGEWTTVDRRGRTARLRIHGTVPSFVSTIFGGVLCSEVHRKGSKRSIVKEPFLVMSIDIDPRRARSLPEAIQHFMEAERVADATPTELMSATGLPGRASRMPDMSVCRRITWDVPLPPVLLFHLKRFGWSRAGAQPRKLDHHIAFPLCLDIDPAWVHAAARHTEWDAWRYRLVAVVTHLGAEWVGGHYIADVAVPQEEATAQMNGGTGAEDQAYRWLCCDDVQVCPASVRAVLARPAYLLAYQRM